MRDEIAIREALNSAKRYQKWLDAYDDGAGRPIDQAQEEVVTLAAEVERLRGRLEPASEEQRAADDWGLSIDDPRFQPRPAQPPAASPVDGAVEKALAWADKTFCGCHDCDHPIALAAEVRRLREELEKALDRSEDPAHASDAERDVDYWRCKASEHFRAFMGCNEERGRLATQVTELQDDLARRGG